MTLIAGAIDSVQSFVTVFIWVYTLLIFAYVILSWVRSPYTTHPVVRFLHDVCDPYLRLFRRVLPPLGPVDLSPIVAVARCCFCSTSSTASSWRTSSERGHQMTYSPVELRHVSLKRSMFGYDRAAVDAMLDDVADSYEQVWRDRVDLGDRIEQLEGELSRHKELEHLLRATLLSAEQAARHRAGEGPLRSG